MSVSSPACKKLGSCHSNLTISKAKINKSSSTKEVTGQNAAPQIGETNRQIQRITAYCSSNLCGNQCWSRENWTVIYKLLEAQCGEFWKLRRDPVIEGFHTFVSFTFWISSRFSQWILKKNLTTTCFPTILPLELFCRNDFEVNQNIQFFLTRSAFRRNCLTRVELAGVLSEPNWPGKEKKPVQGLTSSAPTPPPCGHPVPFQGTDEGTEKHMWSSQCRGTGSLKDWDLILGL